MPKSLLLFFMAMFAYLISWSQNTESEYFKLKKISKKPNITHVALDIGIGMNFLSKLRQHSTGTTQFDNQTSNDDSYTTDESRGLPMIEGDLHFDFIETNKTYFGIGGYFSYAYSPYKVGSNTPDTYGNILYSKGKSSAVNAEGLAKLGLGGPKFKIYLGAGIGNLNVKSTVNGNSSFIVNGTTFNGINHDSIRYNLTYGKAAIGFRVGSNRKNVFDISFYKWVVGKNFYSATDNPGILKNLTSFGKYNDNYPTLPYGVNASYTITGKYKFEIEMRFFRDYDFVSPNANAFMFCLSKQFDFHNHKKK